MSRCRHYYGMWGKVFKIGAFLVAVFLVCTGSYISYTIYKIDHIPKFKVQHERVYTKTFEIDKNMVSYLLFSTGSKGLTSEDGDLLNIGKYRAQMGDGLTDSIMLILTNPANKEVSILSIPRDTYIESKRSRINASYNRGGVNSLIDDVEYLTGIRPDHAISLNFKAFADFVNAVGGVDVNVPTYVLDKEARLSITQPGCNHFDGATALAFARSRHYLVSKDGYNFRAEASSSDWGRIERQQALIRIVTEKILNPTILTTLPAILGAVQNNVTLDESLTFSKILTQAQGWKDGIANIYAATYPGTGRTLPESGAQVIVPDLYSGLLLSQNLATKIGFTPTYRPDLVETLTVRTDSNGTLLTENPMLETYPYPLDTYQKMGVASETATTNGVNTLEDAIGKKFISERTANGSGGTYYKSCIK